MYNILVCDDEKDIRRALNIYLSGEGYAVCEVASGAEAVAELKRNTYHLILMDIMMPGLDGVETTVRIREFSNIPIIFLTAKTEDTDKVLGLTVGGDDYVTKPFSFQTVLARVKAVLKRTESHTTTPPIPATLTKKEHAILQLLKSHPGQYFTREQILQAVWDDDTYVGDRSVDVHIARLRKKLGDNGRCIGNRTGFGYYYTNN